MCSRIFTEHAVANLALWGLQANSHLGAPASTGLSTLYRIMRYSIQGMNKSHYPSFMQMLIIYLQIENNIQNNKISYVDTLH